MSSVTATSSSSSAYTDNLSARVAQKSLGQSDFLKLLTTQMSNQDPMNPISDTDQIAQLAQFSALQSMNSVASELAYLRADTQLQGASGLIGRQVTVTTSKGNVVGTVDSVQADSSHVYVNVGGQQYDYSKIIKVEPKPTATTP
ncbi:MAG: flagellar hook capping FlgD N-terminal domain-containing protein [Nibricoccus sp.]